MASHFYAPLGRGLQLTAVECVQAYHWTGRRLWVDKATIEWANERTMLPPLMMLTSMRTRLLIAVERYNKPLGEWKSLPPSLTTCKSMRTQLKQIISYYIFPCIHFNRISRQISTNSVFADFCCIGWRVYRIAPVPFSNIKEPRFFLLPQLQPNLALPEALDYTEPFLQHISSSSHFHRSLSTCGYSQCTPKRSSSGSSCLASLWQILSLPPKLPLWHPSSQGPRPHQLLPAQATTHVPNSQGSVAIYRHFSTDWPVLQFENNRDFVPGAAVALVNEYDDILYNGFVRIFFGADREDTAGIVPNSPPNVIAYAPVGAGTVLQGPPAMTTLYDDTTVDFFDLLYLYYGCTVGETAAGVPAGCTITATCIIPSNKTVPTQSFNFPTTGAL